MIDFIASKKVNSQGQLDEVDSIGTLITPSAVCEIQGRENKKIDCNHTALIVNQYANTEEILDLASYNLIFSSGDFSKKLCREFYHKLDINLQEKTSIDFILNSILYYNASFDYLRVLLRFTYSSYQNLIECYSKFKVEEASKRLNLQENDWQLALGALITKTRIKKFSKWLKDSSNIPKDISKDFEDLVNKNGKLRIDYQANQLKHGAVPLLRRSDPANISGCRVFVTLDDFYSKNTHKIIFGLPRKSLNIEETQKFLIKYNNTTVKVMNAIRKGIKIIQQ